MPRTLEERRAYHRAYDAANREKRRSYYHNHREARCAQQRAHQRAHPDKKKAYYRKNAKRVRAKQVERDYGITLEQYHHMLTEQEFRCAICPREYWECQRGLAIDHCHRTGTVRRLLCGQCNALLGLASEDPERLERAAAYLRRYGT